MNMPEDAFMLLSYVNTKLRNCGCSPEELCADLGWEEDVLKERLSAAGYRYDEATNSFKAQ